MINIKRNIETKFGSVEVDYVFDPDENIWVGSTNENCCVITSDKDFNELERKLIKMYEVGYVVCKIIDNNPDKNKVDKKVLRDFFNKDWWKLHKN